MMFLTSYRDLCSQNPQHLITTPYDTTSAAQLKAAQVPSDTCHCPALGITGISPQRLQPLRATTQTAGTRNWMLAVCIVRLGNAVCTSEPHSSSFFQECCAAVLLLRRVLMQPAAVSAQTTGKQCLVLKRCRTGPSKPEIQPPRPLRRSALSMQNCQRPISSTAALMRGGLVEIERIKSCLHGLRSTEFAGGWRFTCFTKFGSICLNAATMDSANFAAKPSAKLWSAAKGCLWRFS